jgi:fructose-specific phosphotransferase system IIC component
MLFTQRSTHTPFLLCLAIFITFWLVQLNAFNIIVWSYNFCHFLYGLCAGLLAGYVTVPSRLFKRSLKDNVQALKTGIPWSPWGSLIIVLCLSAYNEMYVDPRENGIPFFSAYQNFVADMLGLGLCLLLGHCTFRDRQGITRTDQCRVINP